MTAAAIIGVLVAMFQSSMLFLPIVMGGLFLLASLMSLALTWVQAAFFVLLTLRLDQPERTSLPLREERGDVTRTVSVKSLLAALVAGTLVAGVTGFVLVYSVRIDDDVLVIAHRGAAGRAPENTLAALAAAIEDGTDLLEVDVQETIDGEVVIIHITTPTFKGSVRRVRSASSQRASTRQRPRRESPA